MTSSELQRILDDARQLRAMELRAAVGAFFSKVRQAMLRPALPKVTPRP
jgi:hypothetical protein